MLSGTRVVSSGAPSPFNLISPNMQNYVIVGLIFQIRSVEDLLDVIRHFGVDCFINESLCF